MKTPRLTIAAAPAADIPGLVLRPYAGEADIPHVVRIQNAEWAADGTRGHMTADGLREYRSSGAVDPEFRRRGIGSVMLADRMAAARSLDATYTDVDRPRLLGMWVDLRNVGGSALA